MFKKIALTLMLLAGSMMLTACGSDSPQDVVKQFYSAVEKKMRIKLMICSPSRKKINKKMRWKSKAKYR